MKKLPLLTATICLLTSGLNAQVTTPTNIALGTTQYVGYSGLPALNSKSLDLINGYNNRPINFFTNNSGANGLAGATQRMTITPTGLVGIGTAGPVSLLQVDGNNIATGQVFRTDAPNVPTFWRMFRGGTEFGRIYNNNDNHFYFQAQNSLGNLIFNTAGTNERLRITEDDRIIAFRKNSGYSDLECQI